ncbi:hypothetical protein FRC11_014091, partial [Ceratobasidium sp. 423]
LWDAQKPSPSGCSMLGGTDMERYYPALGLSATYNRDLRATTLLRQASRLFNHRSKRAPTVLPHGVAITRVDLVASAECIFARYLVPGAKKEVHLPLPCE